MSKDAEKLVATLARTRAVVAKTEKEMATIESLAFESHVGDRQTRRAKRPDGGSLVDTGDRRFKAALDQLQAKALDLATSATDVLKLLRSGPMADSSLRGTLLGDEVSGDGAQRELARLVRKQKERARRREYTPYRVEPQPKAPGGH